MHVMNTVFVFFPSQTFFCLRRSGFVIGVRENGLGARPNFLYAGKTLHSDYVNDFRIQRHKSSSSQLDSPTAEQLSADWLSQRSVPSVLSLRSAFVSPAPLCAQLFFYTPRHIERRNNRSTQRNSLTTILINAFYQFYRFIVAALVTWSRGYMVTCSNGHVVTCSNGHMFSDFHSIKEDSRLQPSALVIFFFYFYFNFFFYIFAQLSL